jgi:hypothetical protein
LRRAGCQNGSILFLVGARLHEFVETADVSVVRVVLIEELEVALVENAEKFLPRDGRKLSIRLAEIYAQDVGTLNYGWAPASAFRPAAVCGPDGTRINTSPKVRWTDGKSRRWALVPELDYPRGLRIGGAPSS